MESPHAIVIRLLEDGGDDRLPDVRQYVYSSMDPLEVLREFGYRPDTAYPNHVYKAFRFDPPLTHESERANRLLVWVVFAPDATFDAEEEGRSVALRPYVRLTIYWQFANAPGPEWEAGEFVGPALEHSKAGAPAEVAKRLWRVLAHTEKVVRERAESEVRLMRYRLRKILSEPGVTSSS